MGETRRQKALRESCECNVGLALWRLMAATLLRDGKVNIVALESRWLDGVVLSITCVVRLSLRHSSPVSRHTCGLRNLCERALREADDGISVERSTIAPSPHSRCELFRNLAVRPMQGDEQVRVGTHTRSPRHAFIHLDKSICYAHPLAPPHSRPGAVPRPVHKLAVEAPLARLGNFIHLCLTQLHLAERGQLLLLALVIARRPAISAIASVVSLQAPSFSLT